ncbi:ATP phosphoribosyltransferase regulatory subunit [Virgibacillus xinjiangensis]|uniref:ATP phosphoribosyltransferase regulatory subunit n=1 Tax=Virgibacillus xinjiangensis TaxID=393090 RepID=A0ABV7CVA7_9BACI
MQNYVLNGNKDTSVEDFQIRDNLISTLKERFKTYGYKQVRTSTFEYYDLYSTITGTVSQDDMMKVVDSSGKVLVLRPDVTIPITRMISANRGTLPADLRLFYVLDVFRQNQEPSDRKETTQAGVEFFGKDTPENNAETIVLAIHTMRDLGFTNFKLEIGHAGLFKELIKQTSINEQELEQLQALIQSKNMAEMNPFLDQLSIEEDVKSAIRSIPLLYGNPADIIRQAEAIIQNTEMKNLLKSLVDVYEVLKDYGEEDALVFNLGLINNMNYYSGIIFQGFVEHVGKPLLMGGRYDNLGEQFSSPMPAIGFAFEVDDLLEAHDQEKLWKEKNAPLSILLEYDRDMQRQGFKLAFQLRKNGWQVLTYPSDHTASQQTPADCIVHYRGDELQLEAGGKVTTFNDTDELTGTLSEMGRDDEWHV